MRFIAVFCYLLCLPSLSWAAGFRVIANPAVAGDQLEQSSLEQIFLGEKLFWDGGGRIIPLQTDGEAEPMHSFIQEILHQDSEHFLAYWRRKVFSGRGVPPRIFDSEVQLVQEVAKIKGSIGIVSLQTALPPDVKVLKVGK